MLSQIHENPRAKIRRGFCLGACLRSHHNPVVAEDGMANEVERAAQVIRITSAPRQECRGSLWPPPAWALDFFVLHPPCGGP